MPDAQAVARAVLDALADADAVVAHRLASLEPPEREAVERRCATAVEGAHG